MDWKAPGNFFSSLNITVRKMFYICFWSFWLHIKTCKKIFCWGFCILFESSIALSKVGVATMQMVPHPCTHHHFTTISWGRSTESFIMIHLLVLQISSVLWRKTLLKSQISASFCMKLVDLYKRTLKFGFSKLFFPTKR